MPKGIYLHKKGQGGRKGRTGIYKRLKPMSEITRKKIGEAQKGEKSHLWKDGRTANRDYRSWLKNRHYYRKKNAEGSHTFGEWELLKKQYGYKCLCCRKTEPEIKLTEDHIIPLDKGGSDYIENIQPLCKCCNSKKHTKIKKYGLN